MRESYRWGVGLSVGCMVVGVGLSVGCMVVGVGLGCGCWFGLWVWREVERGCERLGH